MQTSIFIMLDTRRAKKDKSYPIVYRIVHNGAATTIPTKHSVAKTNWNSKTLSVKNDCDTIPNSKSFNQAISQKVKQLRETIIELEEKEVDITHYSVSELKKILVNKGRAAKMTFVEYTEKIIAEKNEIGRIRIAQLYQYALNFLEKHTGHSNLPFELITPDLLSKVETKYMNKGNNHYNGLSVHLRSIRALFNKAIAEGTTAATNYPFRRGTHEMGKYRIKNEKTKKRAVSKEVIKALEEHADSTNNQYRKRYLNYFLFSFYMRGMNFADLANLKGVNIATGQLEYRRLKTNVHYTIPIGHKVKKVMDYFDAGNKTKEQYLFPIINNDTPRGIINNVRYCTKKTNQHLTEALAELEIDTKITTYTARHTWATIANKSGIERNIISKGLGHANVQTTNIYIDDIVSNDDLAAADEIITS